MKILDWKLKKDNINSCLNLHYSNELNVTVKQLIKHDLIKSEEDIKNLSERELLKIIRIFSNYNEPKFPGLKRKISIF